MNKQQLPITFADEEFGIEPPYDPWDLFDKWVGYIRNFFAAIGLATAVGVFCYFIARYQ